MGYKINLPKEYSCIGIGIPDAHHTTAGEVSLNSGKIKIDVGGLHLKGCKARELHSEGKNDSTELTLGETNEVDVFIGCRTS